MELDFLMDGALPPIVDRHRIQAALRVCAAATSVGDATDLLLALGLIERLPNGPLAMLGQDMEPLLLATDGECDYVGELSMDSAAPR